MIAVVAAAALATSLAMASQISLSPRDMMFFETDLLFFTIFNVSDSILYIFKPKLAIIFFLHFIFLHTQMSGNFLLAKTHGTTKQVKTPFLLCGHVEMISPIMEM